MKGISFIYITNRRQPMLEWFTDGLVKQVQLQQGMPPYQLIIISYFPDAITWRGISNFSNVSMPELLPSIWQGEYRKTGKDYFSASVARNTGIVYANYDYLVFIDDTSVISQSWLQSVLRGYTDEHLILGAYEKHKNMVVEYGQLISSEPLHKDSRIVLCKAGRIACNARLLFGCSFALPLENALQVNGFDEMQSVTGGEDSSFGIRLQRTGIGCYYDRDMLTIESEDHAANDVVFVRMDPLLTKEQYMNTLNKYNIQKSKFGDNTRRDATHLMLDILDQTDQYTALWNFFSLRELREKIKKGEMITIDDMMYPETWWPDNRLITDM